LELRQLKCFIATAEELHFGRAAQRLGMLPAALGRTVRILEDELGTRLFERTTRSVALTEDGLRLLGEARMLIVKADAISTGFRTERRRLDTVLRIGSIDSAATGLLPQLMHDFRAHHPDQSIQIIEDRTLRLLPKLLSGRLDLAFVRPPDRRDPNIEFRHLLHEAVVVALPSPHPLAQHSAISLSDLVGQPLIVPDRRSRPHSYDLTFQLFAEAGLDPRIGQVADEKHTIVTLVAAGLGLAIVPQWTSILATNGVVYRPLVAPAGVSMDRLPLAVAIVRGTTDKRREVLISLLMARLETCSTSD
jgi:DNA-binding transcriptional LysR family regulator